MLLYDLSHTSHSAARTGVQRVALELRRAMRELAHPLQEFTHDPYQQTWRPLQSWEMNALDGAARPSQRRGAYWPWTAKLRGRLTSWKTPGSTFVPPPGNPTAFFTPEIFTSRTGRHLPALFRELGCPKVALFHDAISLQLPAMAPANAVGRFPAYLAELREFDGVAAVSEYSRQALLGYWDWAGWKDCPPVIVSPLGVDHLAKALPSPSTENFPQSPPTILCVGSIEGRKNHLTLLRACEVLWQSGLEFQLRLVGTLQRVTGRSAMSEISSLQAKGRPIKYDGWLPDEGLQRAYSTCRFTVYPSLLEGFGLPVWESLIQGKPCICANTGATAETAAGGGVVTFDPRSPDELSRRIRELVENEETARKLTQEAKNRVPPTWTDCAKRLLDWINVLAETRTN